MSTDARTASPSPLTKSILADEAALKRALDSEFEASLAGAKSQLGDAPALADAINCLLENPALASELSSKAKRLVEAEYSVARMVGRYQAVYEKILGR